MSWQAYVDNMVASGGDNISKGAIIGLDGGVWTPANPECSNVLVVNATEAAALANAMKLKSKETAKLLMATGITLGNHRFMFVRDLYDDGSVILGKKGGHGAVTVQSTNLAVVIAFTPEGKEPRAATTPVNAIADYLKKSNY